MTYVTRDRDRDSFTAHDDEHSATVTVEAIPRAIESTHAAFRVHVVVRLDEERFSAAGNTRDYPAGCCARCAIGHQLDSIAYVSGSTIESIVCSMQCECTRPVLMRAETRIERADRMRANDQRRRALRMIRERAQIPA